VRSCVVGGVCWRRI